MTAASVTAFAVAAALLLVLSVVREREVPASGATRRTPRAGRLWAGCVLAAAVALVATAGRLAGMAL